MGKILKIVGKKYIETVGNILKTAKKITINATNGDILLNAAKSVRFPSKKSSIYKVFTWKSYYIILPFIFL